MKKTLSYLLFLATTLSCRKDNIEPTNYYGYGKADFNNVGVNFNKCRGGKIDSSGNYISIELQKWENYILKNVIIFVKVNLNIGNQRLNIANSNSFPTNLYSNFMTLRDDGDVVCDVYNILEKDSLTNNISILNIDNQTKEVKGTFNATYLIANPNRRCQINAKDTIRVRNGEFKIKID